MWLRIRTLRGFLPAVCLLLGSCAASAPTRVANICQLFESHRPWYKAALRSEKRWDVPLSVSMAFINQESSYNSRAKPPRRKILWVFPGARPSSAFGYAQALDGTWNDYIRQSGNAGARRNNFSDAIDFVGWYNSNSYRRNTIGRYDARNLYLAYHEGNGGYARQTYTGKVGLLNAAQRVQNFSNTYRKQYSSCENDLRKGWFRRTFF